MHPQGIDPVHTPVKGTMTNWNNITAHGFGAADDAWNANGTSARVDLLNYNLARLRSHGKWSLATVTSAMNAAATQDVRAIHTVPLLQELLKGAKAPNARGGARCWPCWSPGARPAATGWTCNNDGKIDNPGAAIMDAAWPKIAAAFMRPELGPSSRASSARW